MRCLDFMKIAEILRLKEMNLFTYCDIAQIDENHQIYGTHE